jgi:hypothetical protein
MSVSFDSRVRIPEDVLVSQTDGESVLLKLKSESYFGLDKVGTRIWDLLLTGQSIQHTYDTILSEFDVEAAQLRADLTELLDSLVQQGLIEITPLQA